MINESPEYLHQEETGGIPVGFKLSTQHIETAIDAVLEVGVD